MTRFMLRTIAGLFLLFSQLVVTPVIASPVKPPAFRNGQWRAILERKDGNNIVFNFDVKDRAGKKGLFFCRAGARLLVAETSREGGSVIDRSRFYGSTL